MQAYCQNVFSSLPVLETPRLRLRPLTMRDDRDMYRTVKGFFIEGVLAGYRQAFSERKGSEQK